MINVAAAAQGILGRENQPLCCPIHNITFR